MKPHLSGWDLKNPLFVDKNPPLSLSLLNHKSNVESWHFVRGIFGKAYFTIQKKQKQKQKTVLIHEEFLRARNRFSVQC